MVPARTVLACALALSLGAACGTGSGSSTGPAAQPTTSAPLSTGSVNPGERVTLEEAGAQPRKPLLLRLSVGSNQKMALVGNSRLEMQQAGARLPGGAAPPIKMVFDQRVDAVDGDGTAHFRMTIADVSVVARPEDSQEIVTRTRALVDQMKGISGTATVDVHGKDQWASFDTSAVSDPTLKSLLESLPSQFGALTAAFPVEPVGLGARWTVARKFTVAGFTMNSITRFTLRDRKGDAYRLDLDQNGTAPPGPVTIPNVSPGTQTSVESFVLHGSGHVEGNLTRVSADTGAVAGEGDAKLTISEGSGPQALTLHIKQDFSLSPA